MEENNDIPTGAEMAAEFEKASGQTQDVTPDTGSTSVDQTQNTSDPTGDVPTVDDSQEITPVAGSQPPVAQPDFNEERSQYLQLIAEMRAELHKARQPAPEAPKPEVPLTVEQLDEIWKQDPIKAMQLAAMASPEVKAMRETLNQFKQAEAQRAEQAFAQRIDTQEKAVAAKYPDFKAGSPVWNAALNYVRQNNGWLRQVASQDPNFNVVEHAYRQVAFDLLQAKNTAQTQKLVDKRAKAGSVKPGGTAPVTPASGSAARDAASDLAQNGAVVPDSWVTNMEKALARYS